MKLNKEQKSLFIDASQKSEVFTIEGFNGVAKPFKTQARVTFDDDKIPGVYDDSIFFEFGKAKSKNGFRGETYAPFLTDINVKNSVFPQFKLIISKITDSKGNIVFENEDTEKYLRFAQKNQQKRKEELYAYGRNISEENMDPVTKNMMEFIGKPVVLDDGKTYVLFNVDNALKKGLTSVEVKIGNLCGGSLIQRSTKLSTIDLDGKKIEIDYDLKYQSDKLEQSKHTVTKNQEEGGRTLE